MFYSVCGIVHIKEPLLLIRKRKSSPCSGDSVFPLMLSCYGRGVTARHHIDEVLQPALVPVMAGRHGMVFQQDNARALSTHLTQDVLYRNNIITMDWPALSPDLNPTEHLWDETERGIDRCHMLPATVQEQTDAVLDVYNNIPRMFIPNLFGSMGHRCAAVIDNDGRHTH